MSAKLQETTSTTTRTRGIRSSYRRQDSGVVFDLNASRLNRRCLSKSRTVEQVTEARLPTELGEFRLIGYRSLTTNEEFVVLARGQMSADLPTLVRIHSQCERCTAMKSRVRIVAVHRLAWVDPDLAKLAHESGRRKLDHEQ